MARRKVREWMRERGGGDAAGATGGERVVAVRVARLEAVPATAGDALARIAYVAAKELSQNKADD